MHLVLISSAIVLCCFTVSVVQWLDCTCSTVLPVDKHFPSTASPLASRTLHAVSLSAMSHALVGSTHARHMGLVTANAPSSKHRPVASTSEVLRLGRKLRCTSKRLLRVDKAFTIQCRATIIQQGSKRVQNYIVNAALGRRRFDMRFPPKCFRNQVEEGSG